MSPCPSCQKHTISFSAKLWSSPAFPASCHSCGKQCYTPDLNGNAVATALIVFIMACGFIAAAMKSTLPLLIGAFLIFLALLFGIWQCHRAKLLTISAQEVADAKKRNWMATIILLIVTSF